VIGAITAGLYAGGVPPVTNSYESIATVTVGSGGTSTISFSSIPSGFKHLQIRAIYETVSFADNIGMTLNGSTALSRMHYLTGNGSSASAGSTTSNLLTLQAGYSTTDYYGMVIDILDYQNTNKYKTVRVLGGVDFNGSGTIFMSSGLYETTSAVSSLTLQGNGSQTIAEFSQFALYGIKG
jgi:hypothetical protein